MTRAPATTEESAGARRAATLLALLPDEAAAQVLAHMTDDEVHRIGVETARLASVSADELATVVERYLECAPLSGALHLGHDRFSRLVRTSRGEQARNLLAGVEEEVTAPEPVDVSGIDPASLAGLLDAEPPQAAALVLSRLDSEVGAQLLAALSPATRNAVATRLARIESTDPETVDAVLETLRLKVQNLGPAPTGIEADGVRLLASILGHLDEEEADEVMQGIEQDDSELADEIRDRGLVLEDVIGIDDRQMAAVVQRLDKKVLSLALKGTTPEVQRKFFGGMSSRAGEMLQEEMQLLGPVRLVDVENARTEVIAVLRKLMEEGTIAIGTGGGDLVT